MRNIRVGFVTLSRVTFSLDFAKSIYERSLKILSAMGVEIVAYDKLALEVEDARAAAKKFHDHDIDLLIIQNGTFAAADLTIELSVLTSVPIILWAIPEPAVNGARLLANSFCGANLNASSLAKFQRPFKFFRALPEDDAFVAEMSAYFRMFKAYVNLKSAKIGWVGMRCPGYYHSSTDESRLRRVVGPSIHHVDLLEVDQEIKAITDNQAIEMYENSTKGRKLDISKEKLAAYGKLGLSMMNIKKRYDIDAFAVKCWPEFPTTLCQAPCAAISWMNDMGVPTSCEGDVEGAVNMLLQTYLTGRQSFFADLIDYDEEKNTCVYWHCGSAPSFLASPGAAVSMHEDFKGVGITVEFPLMPGKITLSRIATIRDEYRLLLDSGEAIETEMLARGNPLKAKMSRDVKELVETIIYQGFPHHYVVSYGDVTYEMKELAKLLNMQVL
ncbi:MAG: L-fucose/L-arabinose isomerase family protein [Oscillospiraceae bacterium]|nr:L-fucose/L-arabinose isomerase family protein [Oscillospiraceae bacterium]